MQYTLTPAVADRASLHSKYSVVIEEHLGLPRTCAPLPPLSLRNPSVVVGRHQSASWDDRHAWQAGLCRAFSIGPREVENSLFIFNNSAKQVNGKFISAGSGLKKPSF